MKSPSESPISCPQAAAIGSNPLPTTLTLLSLGGYNKVEVDFTALTGLRFLDLGRMALRQDIFTLRFPTSLTALQIGSVCLNSQQPEWTPNSPIFACGHLQHLSVDVSRRVTGDEDSVPLLLSVPPCISALTALTSLLIGAFPRLDDPENTTRIVMPPVAPPAVKKLALAADFVTVPRGYPTTEVLVPYKSEPEKWPGS
jgi:hypothetical protein